MMHSYAVLLRHLSHTPHGPYGPNGFRRPNIIEHNAILFT
jgi:hypothetical protein